KKLSNTKTKVQDYEISIAKLNSALQAREEEVQKCKLQIESTDEKLSLIVEQLNKAKESNDKLSKIKQNLSNQLSQLRVENNSNLVKNNELDKANHD
ncbi:hypothetical protein, partial [Klebsiella pneumoniae]|uniref:hypothetical protein n=1 Tax=Klebsiella pneumoniae TaxID=573 RepID=UPI0034E9393F